MDGSAEFPARSRLLKDLLLSGLQAENGGWPHKLDVKNAATSIVSTAHVIEMLRIWDHQYESREIQSGLTYLADQVGVHTQPMRPSGAGRGEWTRFPVFALWGLTRFHRAIADPRFQDGFTFAIKWLARNELVGDGSPGGGWSVQKGVRDLSLTMTAPALHALDRLTLHPRHGGVAHDMTERAREVLVAGAHRVRADQAWWTPYGRNADPSAAGTIMAVLALTNGNAEQLDLARKGARWLMDNASAWVKSIEPDLQLEDRQWRIMSFSLGLRAVVHPRIGVRPSDPRLRPAIEHLSGLWVTEKTGWAEVRGWRPTTTGCFAVVTAAHALRLVCDFDPQKHVLGEDPPHSPPPPARSPLTLRLSIAEQHVLVEALDGERILSCTIRGRAQWKMLMTVAQRHAAAVDDQLAQTIPITELAEICEIKPESALRTLRRLNRRLSEEAAKNGKFLQGLIEHALIEHVVPGDTLENRFGLEQVEVVINGHRHDESADG